MKISLSDITKKLRARGLRHEVKFRPAEDETVDAQLEFHLLGVPSHIHIQFCEVGGGYSVNRGIHKNGQLTAMHFGRTRGSLDAAVDEAISFLCEVVS